MAFRTLLLVRVLSALHTSATHDCDEVYNYFEPLHLLAHRAGFQTWEWSPQFAIRSWAFQFQFLPFVFLARFLNPHDKVRLIALLSGSLPTI